MDLLKNAFNILNASIHDDRARLRELSDSQSLLDEPEQCIEALHVLTNPRKRLTAEMGWFPGIAPNSAAALLAQISSKEPEIRDSYGLSQISKANILAAGMSRLSTCTISTAKDWINELAFTFERWSPEQICATINEDRNVSGFPQITDLDSIKDELRVRQNYYLKAIKCVLDKLPAKELVECVTQLIDSATDYGKHAAPLVLLSDMVDAYEVEAQAFFDHEENTIRDLVSKIEKAAANKQSDNIISSLVERLIDTVNNWDRVAQPIQVNAKGRGLEHEPSRRLAGDIRHLSILLFNSHGKIEFATRLTDMMQSVFAELYSVADIVSQDANTLCQIAADRKQYEQDEQKNKEAWRREISYSTEFGLIFKEKLSISPDGVLLKGQHWPLESIRCIRWGATKHTVNGFHTKTVFMIRVGNGYDFSQLEFNRQDIFTAFTERLWKAVGVRLLFEQIDSWQKGRTLTIGGVEISDSGIKLDRTKFLFFRGERVLCPWPEVSIWNDAGSFCIGKSNDRSVCSMFSYQKLDNVHVLEAAIRLFFKSGKSKLSDLLKDLNNV